MDGMSVACVVVPLFLLAILAAIVAAYFANLRRINKQLEEAFTGYKNALELLKQQPANPEFRQNALKWGRHYSNLTRDRKGVTLFDEVALSNDIGAASAGAGYFPQEEAVAIATTAQSLEQRLDRLKALFDSGAIDEQEYRERRAKILDEV
ncbi:MAG TPA: SHOCT domain-containing protein [Thermoanaerobaculia bacterium]|nr:SHOCT domain-containing protein [Thermoanaerobaculia bacterium]